MFNNVFRVVRSLFCELQVIRNFTASKLTLDFDAVKMVEFMQANMFDVYIFKSRF